MLPVAGSGSSGRGWSLAILVGLIGSLVAGHLALPAGADSEAVAIRSGDLPSGGNYLFEVPAEWNGTLLVFNPGYTFPSPNIRPPSTTGEPERKWLLDRGYALAGGSYSTNGWAVEQALIDRPELLDVFVDAFGEPAHTIAVGGSMGGNVTAALLQYNPELFDGGLSMCGSIGGKIPMMNAYLDAGFLLKTLVDPTSPVELVNVSTNDIQRLQEGLELLRDAQATPEGRARLALAGAMAQLPTWWDEASPKPAPHDWMAQQEQMYLAAQFAVFAPRQQQEQDWGGNFSWNTGVDYRHQLQVSGHQQLVRALYRDASLSLEADLRVLAEAPRIAADPDAVEGARRYFTPSGALADPMLVLHPTGDAAPEVSHAATYEHLAQRAGNRHLVRVAIVDRPGHCTFDSAEVLASIDALTWRVVEGRWGNHATTKQLTQRARQIEQEIGTPDSDPRFIQFEPPLHVRTYYPGEALPGASSVSFDDREQQP